LDGGDELSESFVENMVSVVIGAILGFLSSIGALVYQQRSERNGYRTRLKQELELIREKIQTNVNSNLFVNATFLTDFFVLMRQDLVGKVNASRWDAILKAYFAIERLRLSEPLMQEKYRAALESIDVALRTLG